MAAGLLVSVLLHLAVLASLHRHVPPGVRSAEPPRPALSVRLLAQAYPGLAASTPSAPPSRIARAARPARRPPSHAVSRAPAQAAPDKQAERQATPSIPQAAPLPDETARTIDLDKAFALARSLASEAPSPRTHFPERLPSTPERSLAATLAPVRTVERREGGQWVLQRGATRCVLTPADPGVHERGQFVPKCSVAAR